MHAQSTLPITRIRITRIAGRVLVVILAIAFGGFAGVALADVDMDDMDDMDGGAAETTAGQLDDHEAHSKNPDDMTAESRDPDEMTVESEKLDDHMADSENPDDMMAKSQDPDELVVESENLSDLPEEKPDSGYESIEVPGQKSWEPTTDPELLAARKNLVRAQNRAEVARTVYGDTMRRNYPRGEARVRIVEERDASSEDLEKAKAVLAAAE
jgi:hypothetical protein